MTLKSPEPWELELGAGDVKPNGVNCVARFLGGAKSRRVGFRMKESGCAVLNSGLGWNMDRVGNSGAFEGAGISSRGRNKLLLVTNDGGVTGLAVSSEVNGACCSSWVPAWVSSFSTSSSEDSEWSKLVMFASWSARISRGRDIPIGRRRPSKVYEPSVLRVRRRCRTTRRVDELMLVVVSGSEKTGDGERGMALSHS